MRGGTANCSVVVSDEPIGTPIVEQPSVLVAMNGKSLDKFGPITQKGGVILLNSSLVDDRLGRKDLTVYEIPVNDIAQEIGNSRTANMVMLGAVAAVCGDMVSKESVLNQVRDFFAKRYPDKPKMAEINCAAAEKGFSFLTELRG